MVSTRPDACDIFVESCNQYSEYKYKEMYPDMLMLLYQGFNDEGDGIVEIVDIQRDEEYVLGHTYMCQLIKEKAITVKDMVKYSIDGTPNEFLMKYFDYDEYLSDLWHDGNLIFYSGYNENNPERWLALGDDNLTKYSYHDIHVVANDMDMEVKDAISEALADVLKERSRVLYDIHTELLSR